MDCYYCGDTGVNLSNQGKVNMGFLTGATSRMTYEVTGQTVKCSANSCMKEYQVLGSSSDKGFFQRMTKTMSYSEGFGLAMAQYGLGLNNLVSGFLGIVKPSQPGFLKKNEFHIFSEVRGVVYLIDCYWKFRRYVKAISITCIRGVV